MPGSEPSPASRNSARKSGKRAAQRLRPLPDFERREGVHVHAGQRLLDRAADREIGRAGVFRVDAALQADFGGAALPGFLAAPDDLVEVEIVGPAAQIFAELALREGAELAAEIADIGVVDVAGDDVGDGVARYLRGAAGRRRRRPRRNRRRAPANRRTMSASASVSPAAARSRMSAETLTPTALPLRREAGHATRPLPAAGEGQGEGRRLGAGAGDPRIGAGEALAVDQRAAPGCAASRRASAPGRCA